MSRAASRLLYGWLGALAFLTLASVLAVPADASARLRGSNPPVGGQIPAPLSEAWLDFDAPISPGSVEVRIVRGGGGPRHEVTVTASGSRALIEISPELGPGSYRIDWSVQRTDGEVNGSIAFDVLATEGYLPPTEAGSSGEDVDDLPAESPVTASGPSAVDEATARVRAELNTERLRELGRAITTTALLLAAGAVAFLVVCFRGTPGEAAKLTAWTRLWAVIAIVGVIVERLGVHLAGAGDWTVLRDVDRWVDTASYRSMSLILLVGSAIGMATVSERNALRATRLPQAPREPALMAAGDPALIVPGSADLTSTDHVDDHGWTFMYGGVRYVAPSAALGLAGLALLSTPADAGFIAGWFRTLAMTLHLSAAAAWLGAASASLLVTTHRIVRREPVNLPRLAADSAPLTIGGLFGVVVAGVLLSMGVEGGSATWSNAHWMDLKMAAVACAAALWFVTRAILRRFGTDERAFTRAVLRGGLTVEVTLLMIAVLTAVAAVS